MGVTSLFRALCCFAIVALTSTSWCMWSAFEISSTAQEGNGQKLMAAKLEDQDAIAACKTLCCDSDDCSVMVYLPFPAANENNCQLWRCTSSTESCISGALANATLLEKAIDVPNIPQTQSTGSSTTTTHVMITELSTDKTPIQSTVATSTRNPPSPPPSSSSSSPSTKIFITTPPSSSSSHSTAISWTTTTTSPTPESTSFPTSSLKSSSSSPVSSTAAETISSQSQVPTEDPLLDELQTTVSQDEQKKTTHGIQTDFPTPPTPPNKTLSYPKSIPKPSQIDQPSTIAGSTLLTSRQIKHTFSSPGESNTNTTQISSTTTSASDQPTTEQLTQSLKTATSIKHTNTAQSKTNFLPKETTHTIWQASSSDTTPTQSTSISSFMTSLTTSSKHLGQNRESTTSSPAQTNSTFDTHHENGNYDVSNTTITDPQRGFGNVTNTAQMNIDTANSTTKSLFDEAADSLAQDSGSPSTSHDKPMISASLVAVLAFGLIFLAAVLILIGMRVYSSWQRRHYNRVDFLVNGMYN